MDPMARRSYRDVLNFYGGPMTRGRDVGLRRRRMGRLVRGVRRGWMPKLGLQRARRRGPAFLAELKVRILEAIRTEARERGAAR